MNVRNFALAAGIVYLLIGILGFIPGIVSPIEAGAPDLAVDAGYGRLMSLFPINILHNIVHLAVGAWGLLSFRRFGASRGFARGLAIFYGLLAVLGLIPALNLYTTFRLIPIFGHDVWLHAVTALIAAYFGWAAADDMDERTTTTTRGGAQSY